MIIHVTKDDFTKVISENKKVLVDFWAPWCSPCRMLGQTLEQVSADDDSIVIAKVNCDDEGALCEAFGVESIPLLILFKDGNAIKKSVGNISYDEVLKFYNE